MTGSRLSESPRASIKVRAALAGGLVFGLAAGLTVASWTDAEHVGSTFTASSFDLQTSVQGGAYSGSTSVSGTVAGLYPGAPAYIALKVKTAAVSAAGTVSLSAAANSTGLAAVLRYRIVRTLAACTATSFTGSPVWVTGGGTAAYQQVSVALAATPGLAVGANGSSEVGYCIELGLPPTGVVQGTYAGVSGVPIWNIVGTSS
jgi:predicted ribosomally synthesized peptide with SipW-like signal peptide